jgi:hypothetical protein
MKRVDLSESGGLLEHSGERGGEGEREGYITINGKEMIRGDAWNVEEDQDVVAGADVRGVKLKQILWIFREKL